jgi:aminoglycoside phosphotransferase (APT) family kinase protein
MNDVPEIPPVPDRQLADTDLVRRLVAGQFPRWSGLRVRPVDDQGWDNRTFRLGDEMLVRLPTAAAYALAVAKEHRWLPVFAPGLPLRIPVPLARGEPDEGFPYAWSVYRWLEGDPAGRAVIGDLTAFGSDIAEFLVALQRIDPTGGPGPGLHNWFRGGPLARFDPSVRQALVILAGVIRADAAEEIWDRALRADWDGRPVWFHGDMARGNLLVRDGALGAVIDFGTCGVGDPACDLAIAWTLLHENGRTAFRDRLDPDEATWARGKGWALWKALVGCAGAVRDGDRPPADAWYALEQMLVAGGRPGSPPAS